MNREPRFTLAQTNRYTVGRELGSGWMAVGHVVESLRHERKLAAEVLGREFPLAVLTLCGRAPYSLQRTDSILLHSCSATR